MQKFNQKVKFLPLLCLTITFIVIFTSPSFSCFASTENNTLTQSQGIQGLTKNTTNIVLVHGAWADGSSWSKVIPILKEAGHQVIAVQMPLTSVADDIATVNRAINHIGGPVTLVGHSYGGFVNTNAAYNNPNVTGLVYISAFAPEENQSLSNFLDFTKFPKDLLVYDNEGFIYINPEMFREAIADDVDPAEADIMAVVQKPINQSIFTEKSGPPAWKQLPSWFQVSGSDHALPPDMQRLFAKQINATTVTVNASHASFISHPVETAKLILNATKERTR
jgi:pimeloyl-ACP methyl ester carboxylesterase